MRVRQLTVDQEELTKVILWLARSDTSDRFRAGVAMTLGWLVQGQKSPRFSVEAGE